MAVGPALDQHHLTGLLRAPYKASSAICRAPKPREYSRNPEPRAERIERLTPALSLLLQVDGLIVPCLVEQCTPHGAPTRSGDLVPACQPVQFAELAFF